MVAPRYPGGDFDQPMPLWQRRRLNSRRRRALQELFPMQLAPNVAPPSPVVLIVQPPTPPGQAVAMPVTPILGNRAARQFNFQNHAAARDLMGDFAAIENVPDLEANVYEEAVNGPRTPPNRMNRSPPAAPPRRRIMPRANNIRPPFQDDDDMVWERLSPMSPRGAYGGPRTPPVQRRPSTPRAPRHPRFALNRAAAPGGGGDDDEDEVFQPLSPLVVQGPVTPPIQINYNMPGAPRAHRNQPQRFFPGNFNGRLMSPDNFHPLSPVTPPSPGPFDDHLNPRTPFQIRRRRQAPNAPIAPRRYRSPRPSNPRSSGSSVEGFEPL